jgi:hypothetical protein
MKRILMIVLILALVLSTFVFVPPAQAAPPGPTIVDVAIAVNSEGPFAGQFDTLIAAVLAADPVVSENTVRQRAVHRIRPDRCRL